MVQLNEDKSMKDRTLYLPKTMESWPWPRVINPHYEEVSALSTAWIRSFQAFTPQSQYAFDQIDTGRIAALVYPNASKGKP